MQKPYRPRGLVPPHSSPNSSQAKSDPPKLSDGSPALTPASIARCEFGKHYWNRQADLALYRQQCQAAERLAGERRKWRAAMSRKLAVQAEEWARRRAAAQKARAERDADAARANGASETDAGDVEAGGSLGDHRPASEVSSVLPEN